MSEIDRIISKGIIKSDFLKAETKCDFYIDEKRKKIWAVELDLFLEFDRICKKHNLKYYVMGGSLIGAVRHNGFIPWDDDIDVAMLREDYEKFISVGIDELGEPYFLQLPCKDNDYFYSFAKLRNKNTSAVSEIFKYAKFNQGLFMDIFPLDNCVKKDLKERFNKIKKLTYDISTYMRLTNPELDDNNKKRVENYSGRNPKDTFNEIQSIAQMYNDVNTKYVNTAVFTAYSYDTLLYKKEWLNEIIYADFEGFKVPIPKGYDDVLRVQYGNYMELPPINKRGIEHNGAIFDPDISYKDLIKLTFG